MEDYLTQVVCGEALVREMGSEPVRSIRERKKLASITAFLLEELNQPSKTVDQVETRTQMIFHTLEAAYQLGRQRSRAPIPSQN
jgi:hypothetical protein